MSNDWEALLNCNDIFKFKKHKNDNNDGAIISLPKGKPNISTCDNIYNREDQDECFGCMYIGEHDLTGIQNEDLQALIRRQHKCIGKVCPRILARDLAFKYAEIQEKVNCNLRDNQKPLPDYTSDDIINHWLNHNVDPELQAWLRMWEKQKIAQVALKACLVKNDETGEEFVDEKQHKIYLSTCKDMEELYKSDVTKKQYYSGGAYLDSKSVGSENCTLSFSGKTIIDYMMKKRKERN